MIGFRLFEQRSMQGTVVLMFGEKGEREGLSLPQSIKPELLTMCFTCSEMVKNGNPTQRLVGHCDPSMKRHAHTSVCLKIYIDLHSPADTVNYPPHPLNRRGCVYRMHVLCVCVF